VFASAPLPLRFAVVVTALVGCETPPSQSSPSAPDAAAGGDGGGENASGSSGVSSAGTASGGAGGSTGGNSGAGALAGTSSGGGTGGGSNYAEPIWASIGEVGTCRVLRMTNPDAVKPVLSWTSCGEGCDQGELQTWGLLHGDHWIGAENVRGGGADSRVALQLSSRTDELALGVLLARDGSVLQAIRTEPPSGSEPCLLGGASTWGELFAVNMARESGGWLVESYIALLPVAGDEGVRVSSIGLQYKLPQYMTLGDQKAAWHIGTADSIEAVDLEELGDAREVVPPSAPPVTSRSMSDGCGSIFLLQEMAQIGDQLLPRITYTDGKSSSAQIYLSEAGVGFGGARCADSHVAFVRGTGQKPDNFANFDKVELWASPFADNPADLKPTFVGNVELDMVLRGRSSVSGGYGRYGLLNSWTSVSVWDLPTGEHRSIEATDGLIFGSFLGFTKTDLWIATKTGEFGKDTAIRRYALPPL
jgi:hypothetical protein